MSDAAFAPLPHMAKLIRFCPEKEKQTKSKKPTLGNSRVGSFQILLRKAAKIIGIAHVGTVH